MIFFEETPVPEDTTTQEPIVINIDTITDEGGNFYYVKEYLSEEEITALNEKSEAEEEYKSDLLQALDDIKTSVLSSSSTQQIIDQQEINEEILLRLNNIDSYLIFFFFLYFFNWCWSALRSWRKNSGVK